MVGIESLGKLVGFQKTVGEQEELVRGQKLVHALVLPLLAPILTVVWRATLATKNKQILSTLFLCLKYGIHSVHILVDKWIL